MNMIDTFQIDKTRNTFADELIAAGFLRVLAELFNQRDGESPTLTQVDRGAYFEITTGEPLDMVWVLENVQSFSVAPVILTPYSRKKLSAELASNPHWTVDYETKKQDRAAWMQSFKALPKKSKSAFIKGEADSELNAIGRNYEHWDILRLINPAALIGTNSLLEQWYLIGQASLTGELCKLMFEMFSQSPNDVDGARDAWRTIAKQQGWKLIDASASQFFNPSQGKGINKVLPNNVGAANLKNFWLLEWLKLVGFYEIAFTRTMQGVGDRKSYVPSFGQMTRSAARDIFAKFKRLMPFPEPAISSDVLAVLRYTKAFLQHIEAAQTDEANSDLFALSFEPVQPAHFTHGFHTVFYKDLGNAVATMNVSFLNLPGWVKVANADDSEAFRQILEEHETIVRQFDERKGEDVDLLSLYRDFISADHLAPFFNFTTAYGSWFISQNEKKGGFPPQQFTTPHLRRLLVSTEPKLAPILDKAGFQNIAYAIRQSTVTAQYRKNVVKDKRYQVRYGLGRDLVRQSQYAADFAEALHEFLMTYNAENSQVMERYPKERYPQYHYRRDIRTSDIADILELIDRHGSGLIAKLLVAYGYARSSRQEKTEETLEEDNA